MLSSEKRIVSCSSSHSLVLVYWVYSYQLVHVVHSSFSIRCALLLQQQCHEETWKTIDHPVATHLVSTIPAQRLLVTDFWVWCANLEIPTAPDTVLSLTIKWSPDILQQSSKILSHTSPVAHETSHSIPSKKKSTHPSTPSIQGNNSPSVTTNEDRISRMLLQSA